MKKKAEALVKRMLEKHQVETVVVVARKLTNNISNHQIQKMERKPGNLSVDIDGRLYCDTRLVDSAMILFEEEAKNLLEKELMEGPLNNYLKDDDDDSLLESDDFNISIEEDSDFDENISFDSDYYDINNNDEFDSI